jgi:hypothetical protein
MQTANGLIAGAGLKGMQQLIWLPTWEYYEKYQPPHRSSKEKYFGSSCIYINLFLKDGGYVYHRPQNG